VRIEKEKGPILNTRSTIGSSGIVCCFISLFGLDPTTTWIGVWSRGAKVWTSKDKVGVVEIRETDLVRNRAEGTI
jgi:hypothetical protein